MKELILLDEVSKDEGKVVRDYESNFNMNSLGVKTIGNGWCPVTFIIEKDGKLFGKIATDSVPTEIYDGYTVLVNI